MSEKFLELPIEKQLRIINAGMDVFGKYEYKKASTDEIAFQAGISKGSLFYYFKNKKTFYLYLYEFCMKELNQFIEIEKINELSDFFELLTYGSEQKLKMIQTYPHMTNFIVRTFYAKKESVSEDIDQALRNDMNNTYKKYFKNVDFTKFKGNVDPNQIFNMLTWMSEGYLFEKQRMNPVIDVDEIMKDFNTWKDMFIKLAYKEEYQ